MVFLEITIFEKLALIIVLDSSFITTTPARPTPKKDANAVNVTSLSWHSSMNDSNRNLSQSCWTFNRYSPQRKSMNNSYGNNTSRQNILISNSMSNVSNLSQTNSPSLSFSSPYKYSNDRCDIIADEGDMQKYLKKIEQQDKSMSQVVEHWNEEADRNSKNFLWNYCNNAANLLKTSIYQLAPTSTSQSNSSSKDELGIFRNDCGDNAGNSDIIKTFGSSELTQSVYNLRMWIACTVLHRLEAEIVKTNKAFECRGFFDLKIGCVGLDRLKKTAENQQLVGMAPVLPMIVPFLEMSSNQEYLVRRISDLSKGCVLSEYRWNSGGTYNSLNWDEHLPTDSAIIFHVFCSYLDSQLPPLPQPGGRAFFNRYVVSGDKKTPKEIVAEVKNKTKCAILYTNIMKPKLNFISDGKIHNCVHDRNNIFYVIIEFLIYMKTNNAGLLEGVNLGRSGLNLLRVIEEQQMDY
ncbi:Transmembrane protein [Pseudolycoriella hygida]|uniref:Transmembrane protein n=1 Tax=Pseudolycoriella hygida TaxID=35572 RepID=A0A9Q0N0E0_9DIPT|nr:Transmembrane protein [Pseudolycoriella hygida]